MMDFTKLKKLSIGGVELKQLFIGGVQVWKSGYKNWVRYSTEADGSTIYNGGLGYKDGYRIRSGGAEAAVSGATATGFIPVDGLSVIRVAGTSPFKEGLNTNAINSYDSSFTNIGQIVGNSVGYGIYLQAAWVNYNSNSVIQHEDYWEWVVPPAESGVAYIRVTGHTWDSTIQDEAGSELIVTVNEEIT